MENISYSLSGADDDVSYNEFDDINNREIRSNSKNNRYFDYEYESEDEPNQKIQKPRKRLKNPRKSLKNEDTNKSQKRIPRKKSIKRKNSISKTTNDLNNENDINSNLIIPKKSRKKSISKSAIHQISREEDSENDDNLPKMKAIKHTRQNSERTTISTRTVVKNRKNKKNNQDLSENFDFPNHKNKKSITSLVPKQVHNQNEFLDKEDSYQYKSETEVSNNNQLEIEITFKKDEDENQTDQETLPNNQNKAIQMRSIKDLNDKNNQLINNNVNQKQSFRPKIEEFFYATYSEPPKLRIDTTLVAQSNNHPSLKLSEPYQVSTYSKILDSENSSVNQNNEYILRDLIIASESESNSSKEKMLKPEKIDHLNNHINSNSDYTEVNTKPKDISAFDNENYRKNTNKINPIKLGKDQELVININISDKFNSTPKQIANPQKVDFQGVNETNLTFLNDSQKLNPQIKPKTVENDKKLIISPSIDVYKNQYDLNVVNNCQNASDTVIVRTDNEIPTFRSALQIQQTNSHQQYLSTNNKDNPKNNMRHQNGKDVHSRNISINDHNDNKNSNKNYKNEKQTDRNHKRGNSVPHHKSSHEEQKRNINDRYNTNNNNQEKNNSAYEIQLHHDGNNYVGNIEFRNGKLVRRIRVRKSQRSSSVVPNNSYNRSTNNNQNESPNKNQNIRNQNYLPYNNHHHHNHIYSPNDFNNYVHHQHHYSTQSENERNDHHHHQKRSSSSLNRIRVKKNEINGQQNGQPTNNNSRHHSHRSNSVPRKNFSPLYYDKREINDDANINVSYVYSSSELNNNKKNGKRSSSRIEKVDAFIKEEKETQTPKGRRNKNKIDDTLSSSTNEILQTKSVFIDLSNIDKKEEKPKEKQKVVLSEIDDDLQPMISSDFGANSSNQKKSNWNLSQLNELSQNSSFNSQSESKKKRKKKRQISRSSSRSSISISMATPSPSASEIPTSDYEIIQTPLKEFTKNKNVFISEISSQFQEEEQESEDSSYIRLKQQSKQNKMQNNQTDKKRKNSKISNYDSIGNYSKTNSVKNVKSNINSLFDVASSSDEDDNNNNNKVIEESEINSSHKKTKQIKTNNNSNSEMNSSSSHRHRKRILKEANESSQNFTPTINSDYSSSFYNSKLTSKKI